MSDNPLNPSQMNMSSIETQKHKIPSEILSDIIENILLTYENCAKRAKEESSKVSPSREVHITTKDPNTTKPIFLSDFAQQYDLSILRSLEFSQDSHHKSYQLKHMQVHKQFVYNLCGYHALYNLIELCKLIKSQDLKKSPKEIFNPARYVVSRNLAYLSSHNI